MEPLSVLEKLVSFNTVKDKENNKMVNFIASYLKKYNFEISKVKDRNDNDCLIATIGTNPILGFMGHMDTVDINSNWDSNPFALTEKGKKLIGLGVCDMKGGIAAVLSAIDQIDLPSLKNGIKLIFTTDEELRFSGVKSIIKNKIDLPLYTILCEPTDLYPITITKGSISYRITFHGVSCHSSTPSLGKNAILEALDFVGELKSFVKDMSVDSNNAFTEKHTTFNIGTISGGTMINIVPDNCEIKFEFRTINNKHNVLIENKVTELAMKYGCTIERLINIEVMENKNEHFIEKIELLTKEKKRYELSY